MAKIIKVTGYLVAHDDVNEDRVAEAAKELLGDEFDCVSQGFHAESSSLGEDEFFFYDGTFDNHPLNKFDCPIETCERYFRGE